VPPTDVPSQTPREKLFQLLVAGKSVLRGVRRIGGTVGEVAIEPLLRPLGSAGIDLARIEPAALFLVLEQVVGRRYLLEACLGLLVARMQVGMEFACQLLECVLDLLVGRRPVDTEGLVRVFHAPDPIQATDLRHFPLASNRGAVNDAGKKFSRDRAYRCPP
jgi:hypothetical protein